MAALKRNEHRRLYYARHIKLGKDEATAGTWAGLYALALMSQVECGKIMGISHQAVHQIERTALQKIRAAMLPLRREVLDARGY